MYLVLAAFIAAGIEGSRASKELTWKDCPNNPSCEDEEGRNLWCIDKKLPTGLQESLSALKEKELGWRESGFDQAAIRYAQIKNQEMVDLHELGDDKKRALMIRYF
jgi:glutamine synthetase